MMLFGSPPVRHTDVRRNPLVFDNVSAQPVQRSPAVSPASTAHSAYSDDGISTFAPAKSKPLHFSPTLQLPPRMRVSVLTDEDACPYLYSSTVDQGTFGKIRIALRLGDAQLFCVKELRLAPPSQKPDKHPRLSRHGRLRTEVSSGTMPGIEAAMAFAYGGPFQLADHFQIAEKMYLFFPLAINNVRSAAHQVEASERSVLARYTARHVAQSLMEMHKDKVLHLDVKPRNMLVHYQSPYVALADFGTVQLGENKPGVHGFRSTYCPPEAFKEGNMVDGRADMWALGASVLEILNPQLSLGLESALTPNGGFDIERSAKRLNLFLLARQDPAKPEACGVVAGIEACRRVDAPLVQLVLDHLLVPAFRRDQAPRFLARLEAFHQSERLAPMQMGHILQRLTMHARIALWVKALQQVGEVLPPFPENTNAPA